MNELICITLDKKSSEVISAKELFCRLPHTTKVWLHARANRKLLELLNNGVINITDEGRIQFERDLTPCLTRFLEANWSLAYASDLDENF